MKKQKCNHCDSVFDEAFTECPTCGRDDALMYPFEARPQHTPGPWQQHDNHPTYGTRYASAVWGPKGPGFGLVANCRQSVPQNENIANARLVAAAPDLLEALEDVLTADNEYDACDAIHKANAAIKKAKGE